MMSDLAGMPWAVRFLFGRMRAHPRRAHRGTLDVHRDEGYQKYSCEPIAQVHACRHPTTVGQAILPAAGFSAGYPAIAWPGAASMTIRFHTTRPPYQ